MAVLTSMPQTETLPRESLPPMVSVNGFSHEAPGRFAPLSSAISVSALNAVSTLGGFASTDAGPPSDSSERSSLLSPAEPNAMGSSASGAVPSDNGYSFIGLRSSFDNSFEAAGSFARRGDRLPSLSDAVCLSLSTAEHAGLGGIRGTGGAFGEQQQLMQLMYAGGGGRSNNYSPVNVWNSKPPEALSSGESNGVAGTNTGATSTSSSSTTAPASAASTTSSSTSSGGGMSKVPSDVIGGNSQQQPLNPIIIPRDMNSALGERDLSSNTSPPAPSPAGYAAAAVSN